MANKIVLLFTKMEECVFPFPTIEPQLSTLMNWEEIDSEILDLLYGKELEEWQVVLHWIEWSDQEQDFYGYEYVSDDSFELDAETQRVFDSICDVNLAGEN